MERFDILQHIGYFQRNLLLKCRSNKHPFFVLCNLHYNLHISLQISRQHKALMICKCNTDPGMNKQMKRLEDQETDSQFKKNRSMSKIV